jgi:transmembrane sensor
MSSQRQIPGRKIDVPDQILDQAIDWTLKIRFNTPDQETRQAFERWLDLDIRNKEAWQQIQSSHQGFDILPGSDILDILETVEQKHRSRGITRRNAIKLGVFGGIFLFSAGWGIKNKIFDVRQSLTAATAVGGRRTLRLSEGTVVELNTNTSVSTEFTFRRRQFRLLRGEVLISTGKDTKSPFHRPFFVNTPFGPLEALGTKFCVRIMPESARVCVLEDVVRIWASSYNILAQKGETFVFNRQMVRQVTDSSQRSADWVDGVIVAKRMPLDKLLGELSRYKPENLSWDSGVTALKVSGIYQAHDPDRVLEILSQTLPIKLVLQSDNSIHISYSLQ